MTVVDEQGVPSSVLSRSLEVLEALAAMSQPASLMSIARAADLSKASTYRLLRSLQEQGFIDHVGRRGYRLGTRALALASLISPRPPVLQRVRPIINKLAQGAQESASLHARSNRHRVLLLGAEPMSNPERRHIRLGERAPLTSGCSGMAILAFLPEPEIDEILKLQPDVDADAMRAQIDKVREEGFAISFGSNHAHMHGIASPVMAADNGAVLGSVTISGAADRLPESRLRQFSAPLHAAGRDLGNLLTDVLGPSATMTLDGLDVGPGALYVENAWRV